MRSNEAKEYGIIDNVLTGKKNEPEKEVWQHPSPTPQRPQTSGVQWVLVYALPQNFACT